MSRPLVLSAAFVMAVAVQMPAGAVTTTGTGALSAYPQYGYQYTASWQASAGSFSFVPTIVSSVLFTTFTGSLVSNS